MREKLVEKRPDVGNAGEVTTVATVCMHAPTKLVWLKAGRSNQNRFDEARFGFVQLKVRKL